MKDPISGLRAACTKLIKTNFAPPPPFSPTSDNPGHAGCLEEPAIPPAAIAARPVRHIERDSLTSFNEFGLAEPILRALAQEKYTTPTPIQAQTIPLACQNRDVIGIAQTGT